MWETTQIKEVVGSNPGAIYWMDKCIFMKRPKINEKEARIGPFLKILFNRAFLGLFMVFYNPYN